jgi:MoaA/NifB/PqqE/SkfB family radical SAM enzyme
MELLESGSCPGSATFHPGSICNLACVTCGPDASTRWQKELGMLITPGNPRTIDQDTIIAAKKMTGVIICGGEPMLNFSAEIMLENLQSDQNVRVHFNGTVMPRQSFMDQSSRFERIQYCFSIDGVGKRFEYLRWPAKWDQVVQNILWLVETAPDNVRFSVNITISQLNQNYQDEIVDWVNKTIPHNRNGEKTVITYNDAGNILTQKYLDTVDKKRNLNWRELFPLATASIPNTNVLWNY